MFKSMAFWKNGETVWADSRSITNNVYRQSASGIGGLEQPGTIWWITDDDSGATISDIVQYWGLLAWKEKITGKN